MKTIKLGLIALLATGLSIATVNAQDAAKGKSADKPAAQKSEGAKTNASGQHLKKDGTPDMRYKENKQAAAKTEAKPAEKTSAKSSGKASTGTTTKEKSAKGTKKAAK